MDLRTRLMVEDGDDFHDIPDWEPNHAATKRCYCCPSIEFEDSQTGVRIWRHNAREEAA